MYLQMVRTVCREITYRRVYEDGVQIGGRSIVKSVLLNAPVPEIVMRGIEAPSRHFDLPGSLVYLRDGNAWMIEGNTSKRRALITTGDLDGRIFALSSDGTTFCYSEKPRPGR